MQVLALRADPLCQLGLGTKELPRGLDPRQRPRRRRRIAGSLPLLGLQAAQLRLGVRQLRLDTSNRPLGGLLVTTTLVHLPHEVFEEGFGVRDGRPQTTAAAHERLECLDE